MFGSEVLDVAIGLFVIYLILSTVCSGINEAIAGLLAKRAATLEEGLRSLLRDPQRTGLAKEFFEHPLISSLGSRTRAPSYIPSHLFAVALMDILVPSKEGQPTLGRLRDAATDPEVRSLVVTGSGDAFCAGVLWGLHEGWELTRSLLTGVCIAAASLSEPSCTAGVKSISSSLALGKKFGFRPALEARD